MRACLQIAPWLPGFVGEELPADRLEFVRVHLRDCAACRREAAGYLQANKALRAAATGAVAGALAVPGLQSQHDTDDGETGDGDIHDEIHREIMVRVLREADHAVEAMSWPHRVLLAAGGVLLAAFGFWLAAESPAASVWERPPLVTPAGDTALRAVPYAGPRFQLRPVGLDLDGYGGSAANGYGPGMMGRGQLRTLVEEEYVLPVVERRLR